MMIPKGRLRLGRFTSSATLATLVTPAYATNTNPAASSRPNVPSGRKGRYRALSTRVMPSATKKARTPSENVTRRAWTRPDSLIPAMLSRMRPTAIPSATGRIGMSCTKKRR